jgi:hypothetical protein
LENLCLAWEDFIVGKKKKLAVLDFSRRLMDNIVELHEALVNPAPVASAPVPGGPSYRHGGYESFYITDPKRRHIHKASVRDRLLHHAVYRISYPFFDRTFIGDSFSCRVDKGVHRALNKFRALAYRASQNHTRTVWALKCDIRKFFASIDHGILLGILKEYIADEDIIWLLTNIVESFETVNPHPTLSRGERERIGLPLGNLTSQLFANVYLNKFDHWVKHRLKARYYLRYADDFALLSRDRFWLEAAVPKIQEFLQTRLKLSLHPDKVFIRTLASGVDWVGWVHFADHRVLRTKTKQRMLRNIRQRPAEATLQSYLGHLRHGTAIQLQNEAVSEHWLWQ